MWSRAKRSLDDGETHDELLESWKTTTAHLGRFMILTLGTHVQYERQRDKYVDRYNTLASLSLSLTVSINLVVLETVGV